ncbi:GLUG motif-containing protein [Methanolapillus ohkumae]|uniref:GLUG domain-containing protein n=1 Tax=Methanolapillus ohkumae TaxID=3028298 RepID=A0AA96V8W4_9EURY|nr:hypothetical protein MsAm2_15920 [Methanosarcinaceae archaeon Am2]
MNKYVIFLCIVLCFLFFVFYFPQALAFSGSGSGTPNDPFQITTNNQLNEIRSNLSASYILMNDLDFTGSNIPWEPIGDFQNKTYFSGQLNGNGKIIQNLNISSPKGSYSGLFAYISPRGELTNLSLVNPSVSSESIAGSFAGDNYGLIHNCSAINVEMYSKDNLGGLVGSNSGSISNSRVTGKLFGENMVGGFSGTNYNLINNCSVAGFINGKGNSIGGFVGNNYQGKIQDCYFMGSVSGNDVVGGLVGQNYEGLIDNCYVAGTVFAENGRVGGLAGKNLGILKYSMALNKEISLGAQYFKSENQKSVGKITGINEYPGTIYWCSSWDGMMTNAKFRKEKSKREYVSSVSSEEIWGTFGNKFCWSGYDYYWTLKDFENYQLPVFEWQTESPGDASYLNPENSAEKSKSIPGFELIFGILALAGVAFVYRKMRR